MKIQQLSDYGTLEYKSLRANLDTFSVQTIADEVI